MKNWHNNMETNCYYQRNKITIQEAIYFYYKCWINCNKLFHSKSKQNQFLKEWCKPTKEFAIEIGR